MPNTNLKPKLLHIELLRIFACFFVIFNHSYGFTLFMRYPIGSLHYWVYMPISVICKTVPLFFAISGAILLTGKEDSILTIFKKRILKIGIVLLLFSLFYYFQQERLAGNRFYLKKFIIFLITTEYWHLWYLYALIPFYFSIPVLKSFVKNLSVKNFRYFIFCGIFFQGILPLLELFILKGKTVNLHLKIYWLISLVYLNLFPCLGFFLEHKVSSDEIKKYLPFTFMATLLCGALTCFATFYKMKLDGNTNASENFFQCFSIVFISFEYLFAKYICHKNIFSQKIEKLIYILGGHTFGIYLVHIFVLHQIPQLQKIWSLMRDTLNLNYMISAIIVCICTFIISFAIAFVLKKIPIINKLF